MRASLPVYVVPEEDVLLKRLNIIKTILQKGDLIVVVAEGTLRSMDHMKKDKLMAREALRWIDAHISRESGRLRIRSVQTPLECAEELAAQSPPTSSTVIVTVLTMGQVDDISTIKSMRFFEAENVRSSTEIMKDRKSSTIAMHIVSQAWNVREPSGWEL